MNNEKKIDGCPCQKMDNYWENVFKLVESIQKDTSEARIFLRNVDWNKHLKDITETKQLLIKLNDRLMHSKN